jgi:hypothetical protein
MTTIAIPVALALAMQCAPAVDSHILVGIGQQESGLNTLDLQINGMPSGWPQSHPSMPADAARMAGHFVSAGHNVDLDSTSPFAGHNSKQARLVATVFRSQGGIDDRQRVHLVDPLGRLAGRLGRDSALVAAIIHATAVGITSRVVLEPALLRGRNDRPWFRPTSLALLLVAGDPANFSWITCR